MPKRLGTLLFPEFELLDVFGPLEVFGNRNYSEPLFEVVTVAAAAGLVVSAQGPRAEAQYGLEDCPPLDILLVPGGPGTRRDVENQSLLAWIRARAAQAEWVLSVCTGASLLARAGVLDGKRATTNKRAFQWVVSQGPKVEWVKEARWVEDGNVVTSSGVSAGIDMSLAVVARLAGQDTADYIAKVIEYTWHADSSLDPFARVW
jgi:transcriptional regulator GlxA family with amidase domain